MAIDFDKFTPDEKDNFVRFTISQAEIKAAIFLATAGGKIEKTPQELLEFCFDVAVRKNKRLRKRISFKRRESNKEESEI